MPCTKIQGGTDFPWKGRATHCAQRFAIWLSGVASSLQRASVSCVLNVRALSTCVQAGDCLLTFLDLFLHFVSFLRFYPPCIWLPPANQEWFHQDAHHAFSSFDPKFLAYPLSDPLCVLLQSLLRLFPKHFLVGECSEATCKIFFLLFRAAGAFQRNCM